MYGLIVRAVVALSLALLSSGRAFATSIQAAAGSVPVGSFELLGDPSLCACAETELPANPSTAPGWAWIRDLFQAPSSWAGNSQGSCTMSEVSEVNPRPPTVEPDHVVAAKKRIWEQSLGGPEAAQPYIKELLAGWPKEVLVDRGSLPKSDEEFAWRLARDTWRGLDALTNKQNGLPVDNVRFGEHSVDIAQSHVGDYTNVTNIGLHLVAIAAAQELGFISRSQALEKTRRVLDTLAQLETHDGYFFNYYDTTSLERTSNFLSFVDSSWLTAGLMVVRTTFPEVSGPATRLIQERDYSFLYDRAKRQMWHGYYVNRGARSRFHYGALYTEARLGSLIAIGKGDVPEEHWFGMVRTFPANCPGQTLTPEGTKTKTVRGHTFQAGYYGWNGFKYVPSWGGSMFEALMPTLVVDEQHYAPRSLGANDETHAEVQRQFGLEQLHYPVWGISPSATPHGDGYGEYGVKVLGSRGYAAGPVTPHAAALALSVTPAAAIADLHRLADLYHIYGEYGLYDSVDPHGGQVAHKYLALDQAMLFIALANHLKPHCIQNRFATDPIAQKALPLIGDEDFFH